MECIGLIIQAYRKDKKSLEGIAKKNIEVTAACMRG
jgi:hypothetical protein